MSASDGVVYAPCSMGATGPSVGDLRRGWGGVSTFLPLIVDWGWRIGSFHHCEMGPEERQGLKQEVSPKLCVTFLLQPPELLFLG